MLKRLFSCIDNTSLGGDDTKERIETLCHSSVSMQDTLKEITHVAAVCVYPIFVRQAVQLLSGSGIHVASVAGAFPSGQSPMKVKLSEIQYALDEGADEIDMVLSRGVFLEGDYDKVRNEVASVKQLCKEKTLKVILETGELKTPENIYKASMLAMEGGADFIKTSTGKISVGATPEAAKTMLHAIADFSKNTGKKVGFKASGGISEPEEALGYMKMAEEILGEEYTTNQKFRIGASRLTNKVFQILTL